ncbi:MAG: VOC family protein [Sphaerobacteraceae bacterium]|nr:MAG: VOC family protein [Sphaerobacteraceae bacterium]
MSTPISIVTLGVEDVGRSRQFYEEGMGWPVSSESSEEIVFINLRGTILALYTYEDLAEETGLPMTRGLGFGGITLSQNFSTKEEVDQVMETARAAGALILTPPVDRHWGGYSGYFADLDGYPWEIAWGPNSEFNEDGTLRLRE